MTPDRLARHAARARFAALGLTLGAVVVCCDGSEDAPGGQGGAAGGASAGRSAGSVGHPPASTAGVEAGGGGGERESAAGSSSPAGASNPGGSGGAAGATAHGGAPVVVSGGSSGSSGADAVESPPRVTGVIAVGYGGLRIVSRDLGKTWKNETHWSTDGGDDADLLRTIVYGNRLWLSAGWRLVTSVDGVTWVDHGLAEDVITPIRCPVTDGMAFGAGKFLVACGSNLASSSDGLSWKKVAPTPNVGGHPYLIWDDAEQQFVCSGDDGPSFVSDDGASWTKISLEKAHLCQGAIKPKTECQSFYVQGVFLTTEWGGVIRRSTNGTSFEAAYQDQFENNLFTEYSFGVGSVAP